MFQSIPLRMTTQALYGGVNAIVPPLLVEYTHHVPIASTARRRARKSNGEMITQAGRIKGTARKRRPSGVDVPAATFARFVDALKDGDHEFASLRESFAEWLRAVDEPAVSDIMLAKWLKGAGLVKRRVGRAKVTMYRKGASK